MIACLGIRETSSDQSGRIFSYFGRETFVAPVVWKYELVQRNMEGERISIQNNNADPAWPVVAPGLGLLPTSLSVGIDENGSLCIAKTASEQGGSKTPELVGILPNERKFAFQRAEPIWFGDKRLVGIRGHGQYRFMRIDGQRYATLTHRGCTLILHRDSTHFLMVREEKEHLIVEISNQEKMLSVVLGPIEPNEWFGMRLHGNRLEFLAGYPELEGTVKDANDDIALIVHTDISQVPILVDYDARFLSTEWAGGFVGCLMGVKGHRLRHPHYNIIQSLNVSKVVTGDS